MGVSSQTLIKEKNLLQATFKELNDKIVAHEKQTQVWRNNLNAVHGALQQVEKLIKQDENFAKDGLFDKDGTLPDDTQPTKDGSNPLAKDGLDIKQKEEAQLLNEGEK